jgi:hypothetical protein
MQLLYSVRHRNSLLKFIIESLYIVENRLVRLQHIGELYLHRGRLLAVLVAISSYNASPRPPAEDLASEDSKRGGGPTRQVLLIWDSNYLETGWRSTTSLSGAPPRR